MVLEPESLAPLEPASGAGGGGPPTTEPIGARAADGEQDARQIAANPQQHLLSAGEDVLAGPIDQGPTLMGQAEGNHPHAQPMIG